MTGQQHQDTIVVAAGMPRAGSSWLYRNLSVHPDANISALKEINFFSINYDRGLEWFNSLYRLKSNAAKFDISPFYFFDQQFIENVKESKLNTKLIIILREPNHWVRSLYYQIKSFTLNMPSFADFIKEHTIHFDNRPTTIKLENFDFVGRVNELASSFKGNTMIINFDLIKSNPVRLLKEIEKFSNLPSYYNESNIINEQINASQGKFRWFFYISTNRYLRSLAKKIPLPGLIPFIQRVLFKEGKKNLEGVASGENISAKDKYQLLSNENEVDTKFPPVFKQAFFKEHDIVYL